MIDLDNFKGINDKFGHDVGDIALVSVARILKKHVNGIGKAGRWGGDEFIAIIENTNGAEAMKVAELIRREVEKTEHADYPDLKITTSIGVAEKHINDDMRSLFHRVDKSLYYAKCVLGKNAVGVLKE